MGCGSSKSAVAVVENNNTPKTRNTSTGKLTQASPKKTTSLEHFQVKSLSNTSLKSKSKKNDEKVEQIPSRVSSKISILDLNNNKNKDLTSVTRGSKISLNEDLNMRKPSTAGSAKSTDSGVCEDAERLSSAKSNKSIISGKKTIPKLCYTSK